jgi:anti-sigma factor RsiW
MSDHLSTGLLSALVDGELSEAQLAEVNEHLAACSACTSSALGMSLLKSSTARVGRRYLAPNDLQERMARLASQETPRVPVLPSRATPEPSRRFGTYGWAGLAAMLVLCVSILLAVRGAQQHALVATEQGGLLTEVCDQHIATLAANAPPEVISSDRHTVKPWFQGKIPFSFNLPQNLPADVTLDGANMTYLRSQPTAQLLYSIGRHRVSVFVQEGTQAGSVPLRTDRSGFHVSGFRKGDLEVVAVSDVDPARLSDLIGRIEEAQAGADQQPK